jgi:hypothetical protein
MLGLKDAVITVGNDQPESEKSMAEMNGVPGRNIWNVYIGEAVFWEQSVDVQRECIVHELLHCHTLPILYPVREDAYENRLLSYQEYRLLHDTMHRQMELATDGIAHAIACHFPLPEWGTESEKSDA